MDLCVSSLLFFFFKQKTAYEMRISDWSSDVCSSDLDRHAGQVRGSGHAPDRHRRADDALLLAERTVFELCEMRVHAVPMLAVDNARRDGVDIDRKSTRLNSSH